VFLASIEVLLTERVMVVWGVQSRHACIISNEELDETFQRIDQSLSSSCMAIP
jgi:hypothetical protein